MDFSVSENILLEDDYLLVVHKPAGLMVEPDRNNFPNLLKFVKDYVKKNSLPEAEVYTQHLHRLDRPVSGIVLFAKQKAVLRNLNEQFAERKVRKYYQALTVDRPEIESGMLENWHRKEKKKAVIVEEGMLGAERIRLSYTLAGKLSENYLWEIELHTGKFHQIRLQFSHAGCPIVGDAVYGSTVSYQPNSIALHASKLIFYHPITQKELVVENKVRWNPIGHS